MKPRIAPFVAALAVVIGTQSFAADTCGEVCLPSFWRSATPEEISSAIASVDVTARNGFGQTSLLVASALGTPENIATLLDAGADVNARSKIGNTPLHWAVGLGTPENIMTLLDAGADVNARRESGVTPLHLGALGATPETVMLLLEAGADGAAKDDDGKTPWDYAKNNDKLKDTDAYWALNDARYK